MASDSGCYLYIDDKQIAASSYSEGFEGTAYVVILGKYMQFIFTPFGGSSTITWDVPYNGNGKLLGLSETKGAVTPTYGTGERVTLTERSQPYYFYTVKTGIFIDYNESQIYTSAEPGIATLKTESKYMEDDIKMSFALNQSSWTLLASSDTTCSTTSTSATSHTTIYLGSSNVTADKILYVKIRDKAGKRSGYFLGSDSFFFDYGTANGTTSGTIAGWVKIIHAYSTAGKYTQTTSSGSQTGYGLYPDTLSLANGAIAIYKRYNSSYSLTINGTYSIEVYALDYAPNRGNPFNYSFS